MGMDFRGQVWKWMWKMTVFGLKWGQDLENGQHTPAKNSQEYPPEDFINQKCHTIGVKSVQKLSN